jgi:bacterioferritin-associated ferredoxin
MIVCICHGISDAQLEKVIGAGATSLASVASVCQAGTSCGCCQGDIARRLEQKAACAGCDGQACRKAAETV